MRALLPLVIISGLAVAPVAKAQTAAATRTAAAKPPVAESVAADPAVTQPAFAPAVASRPAAAPAPERTAPHASRPAHSRRSSSARTSDTARASAPTVKSDAVLDLGATDITGNKELPKVMVIVPWKDSLGAGGVVKPADSLMDEVLQPVDRGVFQRRIRYYGQLKSTGQVAPVGDSH